MHSLPVVVCAAGVVGASGKVVVGLVVDGMGNSKVDADNSSSGLRGGMGSWRHMSVGRSGSNRSSSNMFIDSSSSSNMFIGSSSSSSSNRISSNAFGRSSSNTSLAAVACRGSSSKSNNNGLAAVAFFISIDVAPMLFLRPGRRDSSNRRTRGTAAATVQRRSRSQAPAPFLALAGTRGTTAATVQRRSSSQAPAPYVALAGSRGTLATIDRR